MSPAARIRVNAGDIVSPIDNRLYSSFVEHMGRAVYTGIYEPGHPAADADGFRGDVLELIRPLDLAFIRYPGGNFVSGYRWEDGIGPKESRPVRPELAWFALEPNQVGTDEFLSFCQSADVEPMLAVNLGTGTPQDAANLLEYCNFPGGTHYSELRRQNGHAKPYDVKLWCLGNEMDGPWQIGAKTADEYGRVACETAKLMKWLDPTIELVACGSSFHGMPTFGSWERTILRHCYQYIDYLSLHQYYQNLDGDLPSFLARSSEMAGFIREVADICSEIKTELGSGKDIRLSFDEWNVWYHFRQEGKTPALWTVARPIEEELYNFADAILVGSMLITLINQADVVKIACLAQLINTLAPIMTQPGGPAWVQTTYFPFLFTSKYGRGVALKPEVDGPTYDCAIGSQIACIDCAVVLNETRDEVRIFLVNKSLTDAIDCQIILEDLQISRVIETISLTGYPADAVNTANQESVQPKMNQMAFRAAESGLNANLEPLSWHLVRLSVQSSESFFLDRPDHHDPTAKN